MNAEKSQQKDYQRNSLTAQTELSTNKKIVSIFMILSDTFRSGFFQLKLRLKKKMIFKKKKHFKKVSQ